MPLNRSGRFDMDRRLLIASGLAALGSAAAEGARAQDAAPAQGAPPSDARGPDAEHMPPPGQRSPDYAPSNKAETYDHDEMVGQVSNFLGVTAEAAGGVIERAFRDNGRPTGYIAGKEGAGAIGVGLRYGDGLLYMKHRPPQKVFWQGPSIGWDLGGNASRVFTLCYDLQYPDMVYRRFPGVEGSAYLVGGVGVNYQRAEDITLAPIRAGVGLRLGANIGYLAYTRTRHLLPL
jgi:hypothetical protein